MTPFRLFSQPPPSSDLHRVVIIGAGIGGLTTAALLADAGYDVTVLEAQSYAGGSAGTFYYQGYRFEAGATLAGGFHPQGPHAVLSRRLGITWPVRRSDHAWTVHLPEQTISLGNDNEHVLDAFPHSASFWSEQARIADLGWAMAAAGLPWPPTSLAELAKLIRIGAAHFPADLRAVPYAFSTVHNWLKRHGLHRDRAFRRFVDVQLLISAQTVSEHANALYSATALDLARQGVYHVAGGMGNLAQTLVEAIRARGGTVLFKHQVTGITVENGRAVGITVKHRRRNELVFPCDILIANLTPWSLDNLLGEASPSRLRREVSARQAGWGAFVLYLGVDVARLPADLPDHHQIITSLDGPLGEGRSIFVSLSPAWDDRRAPAGHRAITVTTHTAIDPWWDLLERDRAAYDARKAEYSERILTAIETTVPGFRNSVVLQMDGTPVTYETWTHRFRGMVGGFPQESLFRARGPRTGIANVRLVGDSIFPGQSTAGVTAGGMRVAEDIMRAFPYRTTETRFFPQATG